MREGRWLNAAAIVTWLICGFPQFVSIAQGAFGGWPASVWVASYVVYGAALLVLLELVPAGLKRGRYTPLVLIAIQIAAALIVITLSVLYRLGANSTPALLVIIAAILPHLAPSSSRSAPRPARATLSRPLIWSIIVALTVANTAIIASIDPRWTAALTFGLTMGGFMLFAAASSFLVRSETAAREELTAVNAELLTTRALLAENSRVEERLRISRDLHDTLGHHLTALSLQLDVASRLSEGAAADHIRQAHAVTRLLLSDVRDVVSRLREGRPPDLAHSIRALAGMGRDPGDAGRYGVTIHLDVPDALSVDDTSRAEIILRCVQEIITNTARHAEAHNLWIRIEARPDGIALHARDDGRGADAVVCGNGLTGMRERFEQYAGRVEFTAGRDRGFEIRGFLPTPAPA
jgi:signal transduction histidine kinase